VRLEPARWDDPDVQRLARERGWTKLRLETEPRQPEAVGLYLASGYRPIPAFGDYAGSPEAASSLFFERVLG
jgi:hypothetical protein